jgi:hypothetical protein
MTVSVTSAILFASVGLVALGLGLLSRSYSGRALAIGLAGLLALSTVSTWLTYAGPNASRLQEPSGVEAGAGAEIAELKARLQQADEKLAREAAERERLDARLSELLAERDKLAERVRRRDDEVAAESQRLQEARRQIATHEHTIAELTARLAGTPQPTAGTPKGEDPRIAAAEKKAADARDIAERERARADKAEQELRQRVAAGETVPAPPGSAVRRKSGRADAPPLAMPAPLAGSPPGPPLADLRPRLRRGIQSDGFTVSPLKEGAPTREKVGQWYVVRLNEAAGRPLSFAKRQFRKPEAVPALTASAQRLEQEVLARLAASGAKSWRLFVRGSADTMPVVRATEAPPQSMTYVPRRADGTWDFGAKRERTFAERVRNDDLPNLRANWLREEIARAVPSAGPIEVLGNSPSRAGQRTVELLMYVEWS